MREHPRYLSVQFAAERPRLPSVLKAISQALEDLGIHTDTRTELDNLLLGESTAMTVGGLRKRVEGGQAVFREGSGGKPHPFLTEIRERFGKRAGGRTAAGFRRADDVLEPRSGWKG